MQNMLQLHKQPFYFQAFNQEKQTLCSYKDLYMNFIAALFLRIENSGNVHQCPSIEQRQIMIYSLKRLLFNIKMNYLQLEILKVMMLRKEKPGNEQYILCDSMTIKNLENTNLYIVTVIKYIGVILVPSSVLPQLPTLGSPSICYTM